jgi:hypothetical protein
MLGQLRRKVEPPLRDDAVQRAAANPGRIGAVRLSRDWWAVLAALAAVILVKLGVLDGIPW